MSNTESRPTAVLVHAAWFDGSSWNKVTADLERRCHRVVAAQIPLTSFADDVETLRRLLRREAGPMVLAGHSYGGAVITAAAAGDDKVKGLVYIAAVVPDEGETVGQVLMRTAHHPKAPPSTGRGWIPLVECGCLSQRGGTRCLHKGFVAVRVDGSEIKTA